ncbi:MAG: hypothetical protein HQL64_00875 [Magnetococcales bacterium]|nr:hypothetical protein [Magnetococcales bacterium]
MFENINLDYYDNLGQGHDKRGLRKRANNHPLAEDFDLDPGFCTDPDEVDEDFHNREGESCR